MYRRSLAVVVAFLALCALAARAQVPKASPPEPKVIITKLGPITYPQIARVAHVTGEVEIAVSIRPDGTIESANEDSGPALLYRAALESARHSEFECRNCMDAAVPYRVHYTFRLIAGDIGNCPPGSVSPSPYPPNQTFPIITRAGNYVIIVDREPPCYADVIGLKRVRSWKCAYLWRCSRQWY